MHWTALIIFRAVIWRFLRMSWWAREAKSIKTKKWLRSLSPSSCGAMHRSRTSSCRWSWDLWARKKGGRSFAISMDLLINWSSKCTKRRRKSNWRRVSSSTATSSSYCSTAFLIMMSSLCEIALTRRSCCNSRLLCRVSSRKKWWRRTKLGRASCQPRSSFLWSTECLRSGRCIRILACRSERLFRTFMK